MKIGTVREIWRYPVKSMRGEKLEQGALDAAGLVGDRFWALRDDKAGEIAGARRWPALTLCAAAYRKPPRRGETSHVDIALPDGTITRSDAPDVAARLSALLGGPVSLWPLQPASRRAHYRRAQSGAALVGLLGRSRQVRRWIQSAMERTRLGDPIRQEMSREAGDPLPDLSEFPAELIEFVTPPGTYFDAYPLHLLTTASLAEMERLNPGARWDVRRFRPNLLIETEPGVTGAVEVGWRGRRLRIGSVEIHCELPAVRCGITTHAQAELPKDPSILRTIVREAGQCLGTYASVAGNGTVSAGDSVELL